MCRVVWFVLGFLITLAAIALIAIGLPWLLNHVKFLEWIVYGIFGIGILGTCALGGLGFANDRCRNRIRK